MTKFTLKTLKFRYKINLIEKSVETIEKNKKGTIIVKKYKLDEFKKGENTWCASLESMKKDLATDN